MKKLIKITAVIALIGFVLLAGIILTAKIVFTPEKIQLLVRNYVAENFHREVRFEKASLNFIGLTLENFALSEDNSFSNGTFIQANRLVAKVAVKPLFHKRVEIDTLLLDGLDVNIVQKKDNSFNFDSLISPSEKSATEPASGSDEQTKSSFALAARQLTATNCDLSYTDESSGSSTAVKQLNISVTDFDLAKPFTLTIDFTTHLSQQNEPDLDIPVTGNFDLLLADLDFSKAYAEVKTLQARYKNALLSLQGRIENFTSPLITLSGTLDGINNKTFADFLPHADPFSLPTLTFATDIEADLEKSSALLKKLSISMKDNVFSTSGTISWLNTITYQLSGSLKADLEQLVNISGTENNFQPSGRINGTFRASEKKDFTDISGSFHLNNLALQYTPWSLTNTNGTIVLSSLDDISCKALNGVLNGGNFTSSFSYKSVKNVMNLAFNLDLEKLTLTQFSSDTDSATETTPDTPAHQTPPAEETFINVNANVKIGEITIPYFRSNGLTLTADLTNLSDTMSSANGNVSFALQPGAITNLDSLVGENKFVKILLLPLTLIRKVAATLKLDLFPSNQETGSITYTQGEGSYTFTNGLMNVDKTIFKSSVTTINGTGTINFPTDKLDMKVSATLLTQAAPVVFKITGTLAEPKGKLDVVNTLGSVVGGLLNGKSEKAVAKESATDAKNTITNTADTIKQIGNLFKKKK